MEHKLSSLNQGQQPSSLDDIGDRLRRIGFCLLASSLVWNTSSTVSLGQQPLDSASNFVPQSAILLRDTIRRLGSQNISAQIRHQSELFGQQLVGSGSYGQMHDGELLKFRLQLNLRTEEKTTSLRHINDGRFLWILENRDGENEVSRVDLDAVQRSLAGGDGPSKPSFPTAPNVMAVGGLPRLISSLANNFVFGTPVAIKYQETPVWAIGGTWRPKQLAAALPHVKDIVDAQGKINVARLPANFPDRVFVLLGRSDLFPYRIEYRRSDEQEALLTSDNSGSILTMDFFRVNLAANLNPSEFRPQNLGDVRIEDKTAAYLKYSFR